MPLTFEPGQPFQLHLPGGVVNAKIVTQGTYPGDWIIHIEDDETATPEEEG